MVSREGEGTRTSRNIPSTEADRQIREGDVARASREAPSRKLVVARDLEKPSPCELAERARQLMGLKIWRSPLRVRSWEEPASLCDRQVWRSPFCTSSCCGPGPTCRGLSRIGGTFSPGHLWGPAYALQEILINNPGTGTQGQGWAQPGNSSSRARRVLGGSRSASK